MANVDRPNGFRPVRYKNGSPYNGAFTKYYSTGDNLFLGDFVKRAADPVQDTRGDGGVYAEVDRSAAVGDLIVGAVVGWEANPTALTNLYHAASSTYAVYIADDPNLIFEAQSDDATMVQTDVGLNADVAYAAGTTATGMSNMEISGSSANTTQGLQLHLHGMVDRADADNSDSVANQRFLVSINQSAWADQTAGV